MSNEFPPEQRLEVGNLDVSYGDNRILQDVSFQLPRGRMIGLIGPNGAGKSTLLKSVLGLVSRTGGTVSLDGGMLEDISLSERAKIMAYAAQGAPVHWPLTVEKMVTLGRLPHLGPWQKIGEQDHAAVEMALKMTDSYHLRERVVTTLSGGERACAMLARTIVTDAPYLLVDEPVASLDPSHQIQVMGILKKLAAQGHGVLIVLHDLTLARRYCDELVLLNRGRVLARGGPDEVLTDDNLSEAYGIRAVRWQAEGEEFIVPWKKI
ncbi:ABC transporter ATP-binding protein [Emcibacter sp.]|uniref:ABC transporter ATP-binding protein n=1 Tax=Emcibacter sp. TaxID=1979954 RepID=UPI002AA7F8F8|nr:ABC transporter ATP-binding protein [Emcibacter sp.]